MKFYRCISIDSVDSDRSGNVPVDATCHYAHFLVDLLRTLATITPSRHGSRSEDQRCTANQQRDHEPWTSGTVELKGSDLHLYFTCKNGSPRYVLIVNIGYSISKWL